MGVPRTTIHPVSGAAKQAECGCGATLYSACFQTPAAPSPTRSANVRRMPLDGRRDARYAACGQRFPATSRHRAIAALQHFHLRAWHRDTPFSAQAGLSVISAEVTAQDQTPPWNAPLVSG